MGRIGGDEGMVGITGGRLMVGDEDGSGDGEGAPMEITWGSGEGCRLCGRQSRLRDARRDKPAGEGSERMSKAAGCVT